MTYASQTPEFDAQLSRSFGGDLETIAFVQRLCGTFLIGVPLPKPTVVVFAGPSASGKSTLINLFEGILGAHPSGYSARVGGSLLTHSVRPGAFREIRNARVVFSNIQDWRGKLRSQSILSLLKEVPGAKLVVESNDVPKLDDPAAVEMIVIPFQHDETYGLFQAVAGGEVARRELYTTETKTWHESVGVFVEKLLANREKYKELFGLEISTDSNGEYLFRLNPSPEQLEKVRRDKL